MRSDELDGYSGNFWKHILHLILLFPIKRSMRKQKNSYVEIAISDWTFILWENVSREITGWFNRERIAHIAHEQCNGHNRIIGRFRTGKCCISNNSWKHFSFKCHFLPPKIFHCEHRSFKVQLLISYFLTERHLMQFTCYWNFKSSCWILSIYGLLLVILIVHLVYCSLL